MNKIMMSAGIALLVAACAPGESKEQQHDSPVQATTQLNQLVIRARDYVFFDMPDTIPAGATEIRLENHGPELHHVQLVRLEEGKTVEDLLEAAKTTHSYPSWAVEVGGPNTPVPGGTSTTIVNFEPGNYAVICVIPSPDGTLHVMKGMVRGLTVVAQKVQPVLPAADIIMTLKDYSFEVDKPITAGLRTIRVENAAQQSHEVVFIALEEGKSMQDMITWFEGGMQGPPPGRPLGGTTGFAQGEVNVFTYNFTPGKYGLICFLPDAKDGQPHLAHGMVQEFTVGE